MLYASLRIILQVSRAVVSHYGNLHTNALWWRTAAMTTAVIDSSFFPFFFLSFSGTKCNKFEISLPYYVQVFKGSCMTIPCSFDIQNEFEGLLISTCKAEWVIYKQSTQLVNHTTENLIKKDCTTTFNNMQPGHSKTYYFRLECPSRLIWTYTNDSVKINVTGMFWKAKILWIKYVWLAHIKCTVV